MNLQQLNQYPLKVYRAALPNELTIHVIPQRRARVHFQYTVNMGAYQDVVPGTAHFLEHVLLNATHDPDRHAWLGAFDQRGASSNGGTNWLSTNYELTGHARDALSMLEGLTRAVYTFPSQDRSFRHERRVVQAEEFEHAAARGMYRWEAKQRFPDNARLQAPVIGTPTSLRALTIDDLRAMHAKYYAPKNTLLTIAGGVSLKEAEELIAQGVVPVFEAMPVGESVRVPRPNRPRVTRKRLLGARRTPATHVPTQACIDLPVHDAPLDVRRRLSFAIDLLASSNGLITRTMRHQRGGVYAIDSFYASWPDESWELRATLRVSEAHRFFDSALGSLGLLRDGHVPKELFDELRLKKELSASDDRFMCDAIDWVSTLEQDWLSDDYSFEANPLANITLEQIVRDVRRHWSFDEVGSYLLKGFDA